MNTPICDFVRRYIADDALRLHMPGHKGISLLGMEPRDITEIDGADSLYEAGGIIRESEGNAGRLFGCHTFYSTEGSSQCIRAMLYLVLLYARHHERKPLIAAARNVHKTFLSAAALLDVDVQWLDPAQPDSYLSCRLSADDLDEMLSTAAELPAAVYLTSPDYLGTVADVDAIAKVCHRYGVLLLVDNAHGAYLKFLQPSRHPMDLGADLCCDSAHKTLPVLTGGAYLHISYQAPAAFSQQAKNALALFGSTSPSYLILQSLDAANAYLFNGYASRLAAFVQEVQRLKDKLLSKGYVLRGGEPLKLTLCTKPYGYHGREFADLLLEKNVVCEFSDPDFVVLMLTPETGRDGLETLERVLLSVSSQPAVTEEPPAYHRCEQVTSIRNATLSACETVSVEHSVGRVLAVASVSCPPAVPIVVCGERIDKEAQNCFSYYGITECTVMV
ncbi:MAG: aminotransferase class V-fold PLP-dependent enzyme [Clostridia bacterium]|nr:aminotransferase class V-fold PLP-dependent enzyme [Clostridia bacterium]